MAKLQLSYQEHLAEVIKADRKLELGFLEERNQQREREIQEYHKESFRRFGHLHGWRPNDCPPIRIDDDLPEEICEYYQWYCEALYPGWFNPDEFIVTTEQEGLWPEFRATFEQDDCAEPNPIELRIAWKAFLERM
jgi:hypothetical protein